MEAVAIAVLAISVNPASAQNVMRLRIDTVTANPGSTVDVRVIYTFTHTHAYDIHDFVARFIFDTSKSHLVSYVLTGTASENMDLPSDTFGSHTGLVALCDTSVEIDLTDSVLFVIRMTLDSNADTAWIRWDRNWIPFGSGEDFYAGDDGVDSVYQEDGWIRIPQSKAYVAESVSSVLAPLFYPNPARDRVMISDLATSEGATLKAYDAVGALRYEGPVLSGVWNIPSDCRSGAYALVLDSKDGHGRCLGTLIVARR